MPFKYMAKLFFLNRRVINTQAEWESGYLWKEERISGGGGGTHKMGLRGTGVIFPALDCGRMHTFYVVTHRDMHLCSLQSYVCIVHNKTVCK